VTVDWPTVVEVTFAVLLLLAVVGAAATGLHVLYRLAWRPFGGAGRS
jgi:hypothetical protein